MRVNDRGMSTFSRFDVPERVGCSEQVARRSHVHATVVAFRSTVLLLITPPSNIRAKKPGVNGPPPGMTSISSRRTSAKRATERSSSHDSDVDLVYIIIEELTVIYF